jgi:RsiW-degrading membrane proteinase PrsW (M82 family)
VATKYHPTPLFIAFLQALGITIYCSLVGWLMLNGNNLFGPAHTLLGPTLFLLLFIASAVICTLIFLGYPFILFWEHKQTKKALLIISLSTVWLAFFILAIILLLSIHI